MATFPTHPDVYGHMTRVHEHWGVDEYVEEDPALRRAPLGRQEVRDEGRLARLAENMDDLNAARARLREQVAHLEARANGRNAQGRLRRGPFDGPPMRRPINGPPPYRRARERAAAERIARAAAQLDDEQRGVGAPPVQNNPPVREPVNGYDALVWW